MLTDIDANLAAVRESLAHATALDLRCEARTVALEAGLARLEAADRRPDHDHDHDPRGGA